MRQYPPASDDGTFNWTLDATASELETGWDEQERQLYPFFGGQTGDQAAAQSSDFDVGQDGATFGE
jgi:hypothetical protein